MLRTRALSLSLALSALLVAGASGCGGGRAVEPRLAVSYVSGHLGSDSGCSAKAGFADRSAGACLAGVPCPPAPCEEGAVTLQLSNTGTIALDGLEVEELVLQVIDGDSSALSVLDVKRDDGSTFDGSLDPGDVIKVRVRFPAPGYSAVPNGATIEAVIVTGGGKEQRVITPELHVLPSVAT